MPGYSDPSCNAAIGPNPNYLPVLAPYDFTRGGSLLQILRPHRHQGTGLFVEDQIKAGNWDFNLGLREDVYNGLTDANQTQPRVGIAYNIKPSATVLRVSYARTLETPFNENLVLSSNGCSNAVLAPLLACTPGVSGTLQPGYRNEFHAGFQQAFGKRVIVSGEYIWKYTHNAFDFSILGNTPSSSPSTGITPRSPAMRSMSMFPSTTTSAPTSSCRPSPRASSRRSRPAPEPHPRPGLPFRIDHDEKFNQTTHLHYQIPKADSAGLWGGFNWRYDSGLVAGSVPFATDNTTPVDLSGLTFDQRPGRYHLQRRQGHPTAGFQFVLPIAVLLVAGQHPRAGTENDDKNPPRIAPRNLFDAPRQGQHLPHRPLQNRPRPHRHQRHQQVRPLQLPLHLQRHALRHSPRPHRQGDLQLLTAV